MSIRPAPKPEPRRPKAQKPIAAKGPRAWKPAARAGVGACAYCGKWAHLTWDHVIQRSLAPELRDDSRNLVRACVECNVARGRGYKPSWQNLSPQTRAFVLEHKGEQWAARYFEGVE